MKKITILIISILLLLLFSNCEKTTNAEEDKYTGIIEGVDFDSLFAIPTESEISEIKQEWQSREVVSSNVSVVYGEDFSIDATTYTLRVVSQEIDGNAHYFAIIIPKNSAVNSLPVMLYSHGGDNGVGIAEIVSFAMLNINFREIISNFALVIPTFRSETLVVNENLSFVSEGEPSPWDHDVDDAIASINDAIKITPQIDSTQISTFGISRGACVAMLMSIRDSRIETIIEFFGPTDFFGEYVKEITANTLKGGEEDLPGFTFMKENYIIPLKNGTITINEVRHELISRSPVYFINNLAPLQLHHGTSDEVVLVSQAKRMIEVYNEADFDDDRFEYYLYDGAKHDIYTVILGMTEALNFIKRFISYSVIV